MPGVGDWTTPALTVYPFDGSTATTLTVLKPDGTSDSPPLAEPTEVDVQVEVDETTVTVTAQRWATAAPVQYTDDGWWVLLWTVTGVGAGAEPQRVYVAPNPAVGGPTWTPTRENVAAYVPSRTVRVDDPDGTVLHVFTDDTRPTGGEVDNLIVDAVSWTLGPVGALNATAVNAAALADLAKACASLRAAGMVEITWPDRDADVNTGQTLLAQADAMRKDLVAANTAANGGDDPGTSEVAPVWSFPAAPPWADSLL